MSTSLNWLLAIAIPVLAGLLMLLTGGVTAGPRAVAGVTMAMLFLLVWGWRLGADTALPGGTASEAAPWGWERAWLVVWLALSGWVLLQLLPLPRAAFDWLGAYPPELLAEYPELPVRRVSPHLRGTIGWWASFTTYWGTAWLVASLPRRPLNLLVGLLVGLIFAQALYGFVAHVVRAETVLGLWSARAQHSMVIGTFYNRNHFAGLMALGWPLGIAWLLFGTRVRPGRIHEFRYLLVLVFCLVLALALFNSLSRLGSAAGLFGLLVFVLLARANRAAGVALAERLWLSAAGLVALGLAISFGLLPLLLRYAALPTDHARLEGLLVLGQLPVKTWVAGAGAGAFEDVFKLVQPVTMRPTIDYLHNDWMQFLLEFGLLGSALALAALVWWWRQVGPVRMGRLRAGAAGGIAAIALHSLGDFNLQIPGTAFVFWIAVGVLCNRALAAAAGERRPTVTGAAKANAKTSGERRRRGRRLGGAPVARAGARLVAGGGGSGR